MTPAHLDVQCRVSPGGAVLWWSRLSESNRRPSHYEESVVCPSSRWDANSGVSRFMLVRRLLLPRLLGWLLSVA